MATAWDTMSPYHQLGVKPGAAPERSSMPGIARSSGPGMLDATADKLWHPDNPLFWFGVIALATFGAIAGSTSIKVGPFRASAGVGTS
jgi:hypothetical protein